MNAPVDVTPGLALLQEAAARLPKSKWDAGQRAVAAVAELAETQRELLLEIERARAFETDVLQRIPCDTLDRANAALARVGGAKS